MSSGGGRRWGDGDGGRGRDSPGGGEYLAASDGPWLARRLSSGRKVGGGFSSEAHVHPGGGEVGGIPYFLRHFLKITSAKE